MAENYSLHNLILNIATLGVRNGKISKDEFMEQYKGTAKEKSMEKIFTIFDKFDTKNDGTIDLVTVSMSKWSGAMQDNFFNYDNKTKEFTFSEKKFKDIFGEQVSIDNFQEALVGLQNLVAEKENMYARSRLEENIKNKQADYQDIPEEILAKILFYCGSDADIKSVDNGYEAVSYEDGDKDIKFFNSNGNLLKEFISYSKKFVGEYGNLVSAVTMFDDKGNYKASVEKYEGGYTCTYDENRNGFLQYGKNEFAYTPNLKQITVNKGLPNETSFNVTMDEKGIITDISLDNNNQVIKMSDKTKNLLIKLLNNNAVLGLNFDLNVNCNEVFVEIIKDDNIPEKAASAIDELGYAGLLKDVDYKTEFLENGDYVIEYLSNKSRDFVCDKKKTIFSADGTEKTLEIKGNKVLVTENGETKEYTVEEFLKIMPEENGFVKEEGIVAEEPQNYQLFKIEESELAEELYKVGDRKYSSDTEYTQTVGKNTYTVAIIEDKISVKRDGKEFFIDVSGMTQGAKKFIAESNPVALYRMADKGIKLILQPPPTGGDGEYLPEENVIYIDPEASDIPTLQRRIAHEVGHSYYTHVNPVNKELEDKFKEESDKYASEVEAIKASVTPAETAYDTELKKVEALKQFDKWAPDDSNARYCATNVYEFVAEAYCLLVTGDAKSEFTIAKVYPEAFELAKKMIEAEDN